MYVKRHSVTILTTTATTGTFYTSQVLNGPVSAVRYRKGTTGISTGATIALTGDRTGIAVLSAAAGSASWTKAPRLTVVNTTNGAITNSYAPIPVAQERVKVVVSNSTKSGQGGTIEIYEGGV